MKVQEEKEEEEDEKEERRMAMRYPLVRHIRDQPTGTLMHAVVILYFSFKEFLFLAHVTSPLFYFLCLFQVQKRSFSIFLFYFDRSTRANSTVLHRHDSCKYNIIKDDNYKLLN